MRFLALLLLIPAVASAQWTNRYPKNAGYAHHVYLEGYELPILANGAVDAAPGRGDVGTIVAAQGWLWRFDERTGVAKRLTSGAGVDSRPAWSPDGSRLAFVRDDSKTLAVVVRDMASGSEVELDRGMAMDPVFAPDGKSIVYANTAAGDLDLWRADLATKTKTRLTTEAGLEVRPQFLPDGARLVYTSKTRAGDQIRLRSLGDGKESVLLAGNIVSQTRPAVSPGGTLLVYNWPGTSGWELRLMSIDRPGASILLVGRPRGRPITPAWSADGSAIWFSESDSLQRMHLYRVASVGGAVEEVVVRQWDWGVPMTRIAVTTVAAAGTGAGTRPQTGGDAASRVPGGPIPARLTVRDSSGHPLLPASGMTRFDGENGVAYFYSPGTVELEVPVGPITVQAVRGFATPLTEGRVVATPNETARLTIPLRTLWDAQTRGWYSGDHHFHLNYGGQFDLAPRDILPLLAGEDLDVATPMLANLHNRFEDQPYFSWSTSTGAPIVRWAQEVRSHFLGHVGLIGTSRLFWPWVWGPGYEVYGRDDRRNEDPLQFARAQGGAGMYVHPVQRLEAFTDAGLSAIPLALIPDATHGNIDLLEIVCLWSNSIGTTDLWYRLLNAGFPIAPSGGTDVMTDFYRTMALGATRVYVRPDGPLTWESYLAALKAGRSFVSTGPLVELTVDGRQPGDSLPNGGRRVPFRLTVASATPVDSIAVVVNGRSVWSGGAIDSAGTRTLTGHVSLPAGGWVAARVLGSRPNRWPVMAEFPFAHSAPIWISGRGSTEPAARRAAARDLLRALAVGEQRLAAGYGDTAIPKLRQQFVEARATLEERSR